MTRFLCLHRMRDDIGAYDLPKAGANPHRVGRGQQTPDLVLKFSRPSILNFSITL